MTIDEAIATIKDEKWICCQEKYIEALNLMENIMHKYQKIEDIYYHQRGEALENSLRAVVEDGKYLAK